jgi:signal transduction histidine kinase
VTAERVARVDEKLLEESAEELYEQAPCGYLSTLPDGTIVRVNRTLLDWVAQSRDELLERRKFQDLLTVPGRIYYETHLGPLLRMQGFASEIAFELGCGESSPTPVLVTAVQKRDDQGEPLFTRFTVFKATERRKYERELLVERKRAERADRRKAELLAMIGHDMRTPLNAIGGAVQLLELLSPTPQQLKYLRVLHSSSAALLRLANQILDFSRIEAGQLVVESERFDPRVLIRDIADSLLGQAEQKGLALRTEIEERIPPALVGDSGKIQQVLVNIMANAVKFTETGSVTLSARVLGIDDASALLEFSVADTGIGIPAERLEAIFEEFTQADAEIGKKYGGTGLGLTISRRLAALLGGVLEVESEVGRGSTFRFQVRLAGVNRPPSPAARRGS